MLREFGYAARTLRASRSFTVAAVITLALGIGASTAIFSVANAVLLQPLPYKEPARLVYACNDLKNRSVTDDLWSGTNYIDLRDQSKASLENVAAVATGRSSYTRDDGTPEEVVEAQVTPNIFRTLGARVVLGRDFIDSDGRPEPVDPSGVLESVNRLPTYAIASQEFFQRRFGGNPAFLGQPIVKNGPILIGVVERGVELLFRPDKEVEPRPDLWLAWRLHYSEKGRSSHYLRVIARLRPGVTLERAQSEADAVAGEIGAIDSAYRGAGLAIHLQPMQPFLVAYVRPAILALTGAVIFLLLIACSNVTNLFLVRYSLRSRDLAIRTAIGASWRRLARQMLAEALFVSALGSAMGFGLAWAGVRQLLAVAPPNLPRLNGVRIDLAVLAFGIGAGLFASVLFTLAPALRVARLDVAEVLRAGSRTGGLNGGLFIRNFVLVAEVALCFVLLVGSGLMFRSFLALQGIRPGYDPHNLMTFRIMGGKSSPTSEGRSAVVRQMQTALSAIPGVRSVTAATLLPLTGSFLLGRWSTGGAPNDPSRFQSADMQFVIPGYFATMRTPLLAGRDFNASDHNPHSRLVIIDRLFSAKAFPSGNAVGQRIILSRINSPATNEWYNIVGVVAHQRLTSLAEPGREQVYIPIETLNFQAAQAWAVRTTRDPASYATSVRTEMAKFDRSMLLTDMQTMDSVVQRAQTGTRFSLYLIAAFAVSAALLASVGLYGVLSTVVRQRTVEIGVRMALGASPAGILGLVVAYGLRLSALGLGAGFIAAFLLTRVMTAMLVGIQPTDPPTFAAMAALFFLIAALASWIPARRAATLEPSSALREG